uniref:S.cerevisiae BNI1, N0647, APL1, N0665, N0670, LYP1, PIK1, N0800, N0809, N0810, N0815, N0820, POL2, and N0830 genes n=1 Tax=Saccharomyces cerevisiae TaxID=4932 RepID=A2NYC5_YEASX|nr:unnamed protein product [Saccharomyces cerevisiae]
MVLISRSSKDGSNVHRLRKDLLMGMSAENIATGMARSVTGALKGFELIIYLHCRPLSFTISSPKKSPNLLAVVIEVDFCPSYSFKVFDILLFSQIKLTKSSSSNIRPCESRTSNQRLHTLATAL